MYALNIISENLANAIDTGRSAELGPEIYVDVPAYTASIAASWHAGLCDVLGSINTETINIVRCHKLLDPVLVSRNDRGVLCVNIGKRDFRVTKPTVLFAGDVAVVDGTIWVV